ncbi:Protein unc-93 A [Chamberlinius hualienensis]
MNYGQTICAAIHEGNGSSGHLKSEDFVSNSDDDHLSENDPLINGERNIDRNNVKYRIWCTIGLLNTTAFFLFMGVIPIALVQSSLNSDAGLGVTAMSVKHLSMIIGSFVAPSIIYKIGCKWAGVLGVGLYILFVPANFYPSWFMLITAAVISGIGCSVQSVAVKVYLARLAHVYSNVSNVEEERINSRIFVVHMVFFYFASVANVIGSLILNSGISNDMYNGTIHDVGINFEQKPCGARYCNQLLNSDGENNATDLDYMIENRIYLFVGFCTASCFVAFLLSLCIKPLTYFEVNTRDDHRNIWPLNAVCNVFKSMFSLRYFLFIPIAIIENGALSFWAADFTKAFITCSIGVSYIGYVSVWMGLGAAIAAGVIGPLNKKNRSYVFVTLSTLLQIIIFMLLFCWKPSISQTVNYWELSAFTMMFYISNGMRSFIIPVLITSVFKNDLETAFSFYNCWLNVAATVFYYISNILCVYIKIYTLMGLAVISFMAYIIIDVLERRSTFNRCFSNQT